MEILNRTVAGGIITCETYEGIIEISEDVFRQWADDNQKREWIYVWPNHEGEPVEESGTMDWDIYYDSGSIYKDISEYIISHHIKPII